MGVNLKQELLKLRSTEGRETYQNVLNAYRALLDQPSEGERILVNLFHSEGGEAQLNFDVLDPEKIFHIDQIKKLCIDFRLRFLDSSLFNGTYPQEAIDAIGELERQHEQEIVGFKIIAPAPMFKLTEKDKDPLLMVPMGGGYYYLVAQWGNDLHPLRKWSVYPFRTFETMLRTVVGLSALLALAIPADWMRGPHDTTIVHIRVIFFFYLIIALGSLSTLYGFSKMKNFNANLWKSKYLD